MTCKLDLLLPFIDSDKLPWDYQELIRIVGLEKTLEIADRIGGTHIYMEKLDTILMPAKRDYIMEERRKTLRGGADLNVRMVARDMDISQAIVYEMLKPDRSNEEKDGWKQETLI